MTDTPAKAAIVTGASGGIGRAVALRLASDGFAVVANYAGNAAKADEAVTEIKTACGHAIAIQADVANAADVERLFRDTLDTFGRIDVCAGIMPLGPIAEGNLEVFDRVIATNLRGAFILMGQPSMSPRAAASSRSQAASSPNPFQDTAPTSPRRPGSRAWFQCSRTSCAAVRLLSTRWRPARWRLNSS
jgi:NAD(P)-dependent dehydrogenase (short-subunit alcohol dehydrogenase family)